MSSIRKPVVAGNWKLNLKIAAGRELALGLAREVGDVSDVDVVLAPVSTVLTTVAEAVAGTNIALAGQNMYWENAGAFTGEVGADHLLDVGCRYVIVGHSERREYFGESDEDVRRKAGAALDNGLSPILCIGETLSTRESGKAESHVVAQVVAGLTGMTSEQLGRVILAYEPIWAIGTGKTASPADAQQMHKAIRGAVSAEHGQDVANGMRILYGGSVKADNAPELMSELDVDGALVGGASLKVDSFAAIVRAAR